MSERDARHEGELASTGEAFDSEISYGLLVKLGFGLLATVVVSAVLMYFLFAAFLGWEKEREPAAPVLPEARAPIVVPGANLLAEPEKNLETYQETVNQRLHSYGYVGGDRETVHIPIDRAIEIVAERGLPQLPSAPADVAAAAEEAPTEEAGPEIAPRPEEDPSDAGDDSEPEEGTSR